MGTRHISSLVEYQVSAFVRPCSKFLIFGRTPKLTHRPADTVLTRMYNQNTVKDPITGRVRGALYTNPIDCLWKTFKAEGIAGWYKGE